MVQIVLFYFHLHHDTTNIAFTDRKVIQKVMKVEHFSCTLSQFYNIIKTNTIQNCCKEKSFLA